MGAKLATATPLIVAGGGGGNNFGSPPPSSAGGQVSELGAGAFSTSRPGFGGSFPATSPVKCTGPGGGFYTSGEQIGESYGFLGIRIEV